MNEVSYKPLIEDMTWSYSRLTSFKDCKYKWYLNYISYPAPEKRKLFFSSYGSFMHKIIEMYYKGKLSKFQMVDKYLDEYEDKVIKAPNNALFKSYFSGGIDYLRNFKPFKYQVIDVERRVNFKIGNRKFVGVIDIVAKDIDGNIVIIDHKSRALKPRSNRKKPTKTDEELDDYLKQLYLYSIPVNELYGEYPKYLCFNCFKTQTFIREEFKQSELDKAIKWINDTINDIEEEIGFEPDVDFFKCTHLCDVHDSCWKYELFKRK